MLVDVTDDLCRSPIIQGCKFDISEYRKHQVRDREAKAESAHVEQEKAVKRDGWCADEFAAVASDILTFR